MGLRLAAFPLFFLAALGCGGRSAAPVTSSPVDRPEAPAQAGLKRSTPKPAERIDRPAPNPPATVDDTRDADRDQENARAEDAGSGGGAGPEADGEAGANPRRVAGADPRRETATEPQRAAAAEPARDDRTTGVVHILRRGQTLYSVARLYDLPVASLMKANGIVNARSIPAGTRIFVPGVTRAVPYRSTKTGGKKNAGEGLATAPVTV